MVLFDRDRCITFVTFRFNHYFLVYGEVGLYVGGEADLARLIHIVASET